MSYGLAIVNPTLTENRVAHIADEGALILRCQAGEKQAYGELVNKYMKRAYYTALGLIGSPKAAMDLSQEAFIRAYRAIKRLDADKKFFTWYYRILKNLCLNYLRDRARQARPFSEVGETTLLKNIVGGEIEEYTKLMAEAREQALDRMKAAAEEMGANAIVDVSFSTSYIMGMASEILSYGTAVVVE